MKKLLTLFLSLTILLGVCVSPAYAAPEWPANIALESEGGIVIDANSGAVIYGKQIHERFFPASITKILTALIVIEECDMDEIVTFSRNAVYNVESGSSNANLEAGDELTVRDALYAMMLKSANEAANALAEHVGGSIDGFAKMMNDKATELGCRNSNFCNPSGLNDENHFTTPYDMALIAQAAFNNETFTEIASVLLYDLPATIRETEGQRIYPKHRMIKKNLSEYYEGAIGGKTGYTMKAGHSLVTCAERNGMKLIAVILKGNNTHYSDTKTLLDFGFNNFTSLRISDYETRYTSIENDLTIGGLPAADLSVLTFTKDSTITLPNSFVFTDAESSITYDLTPNDPDNAVAKINYSYNERPIGSAYLVRSDAIMASEQTEVTVLNIGGEAISDESNSDSSSPQDQVDTDAGDEALGTPSTPTNTEVPATTAAPIDTTPFEVPPVVFAVIGGIIVIAALIAVFIVWLNRSRQKEEEERRLRSERRQQRLREMGVSVSDFEKMVQKRRTSGNSDEEEQL